VGVDFRDGCTVSFRRWGEAQNPSERAVELIRTLRDLGVGPPTIARVLARELTVAEVAHAQADALEATVRTLRLRQAGLLSVLPDTLGV
jgi:hypothetical protein